MSLYMSIIILHLNYTLKHLLVSVVLLCCLCFVGDIIDRDMPKLIDNYVLSRKIGAGQYGEVYKGYDRATNNDIAVKSIRR